MYTKLKNFVFTLIFIVLWLRYFCMIWDPYWGNVPLEQGLALYRDWRSPLDIMYQVSGYLMAPVYLVYGWLEPFLPKLSWFPGMASATVLANIASWMQNTPALADKAPALQTPLIQQSMVGYIDFLVVPALVFYRLLSPLLDKLVELVKNLFWNVMIEFSFTKRKESKYQEALEKRAADLVKLNVQYKNLSKEASVLAQSVITDELTQVYNKRFFIEKITFEFTQAKAKKQVLSIAMVDIDHFKKLNDNYGHLLGDKVLKAVAQVAKANTPADCFCCRFGGEEFAIVMPGKRREEALAIISNVHESLPRLRFEDDINLRTSASFGVCVADFKQPDAQALENFEAFIKGADDELYRAKLNGRNRIECNELGVPRPEA